MIIAKCKETCGFGHSGYDGYCKNKFVWFGDTPCAIIVMTKTGRQARRITAKADNAICNQIIDQAVGLSVGPSVGFMFGRPAGPSVGLLLCASVGPSVGPSLWTN